MTSHADHPDRNGPPAWIQSEKKQFEEQHDKNGDGKLDRNEILDWIIPSAHATGNQDEAKHLLTESDANGVSFFYNLGSNLYITFNKLNCTSQSYCFLNVEKKSSISSGT